MIRIRLPPAMAAELQALSTQAGDWNDAFFALSTLYRALDLVVQGGQSVVLLLDRFDEACRQLDAQALSSLRSLRDRFKGRLVFVAATRHPLARLRPPAEIDEFYELVAGRTCWVGPMVARDAHWVAEQMEEHMRLLKAQQSPLDAARDMTEKLTGQLRNLLRDPGAVASHFGHEISAQATSILPRSLRRTSADVPRTPIDDFMHAMATHAEVE